MPSLINCVAIAALAVGLSFIRPAHTITIKLSKIFFEDNTADDSPRAIFPRRNLVEELGEYEYKCLVSSALSTDGGICLSEKAFNDGKYSPPSITPLIRPEYGVDVSFPMHDKNVYFSKVKDDGRDDIYSSYLKRCQIFYEKDGKKCIRSEEDRLDICRNQPPVMQNYTTLGFQKTTIPDDVFRYILDFWNRNEHRALRERWHPGDIYTNHWDVPTYMVPLDNPDLEGGGGHLKSKIWDAVKEKLQRWIDSEAESFGYLNNYPLSRASLYGIRVYSRGSILAPHVDRLPLVTSAIINVAQKVEDPWPLEVIGHDGIAYNITLEPGEMILYESHSIIHGRPFPLQGDYYANIFVHFEPRGHSMRHVDRMTGVKLDIDAEELYKRAQRKLSNQNESPSTVRDKVMLPFYIHSDSKEAERWRQKEAYEKNKIEIGMEPPPLHINQAAALGLLPVLQAYLEDNNNDPSSLSASDGNGWQPIHEAARSGRTEIIAWLIEKGVDINARTNNGKGASALWWAEESVGSNHPTTKLLKDAGAKNIPPEFN